jgi:hypothetical protein
MRIFSLRRKLASGGAPDLFDNLFRRFLHRPGFLSHLRSFNGYDGPEILPSSTRPFCLIALMPDNLLPRLVIPSSFALPPVLA